MIKIIWRGLGFIVPVLSFLTAWILSYWFEDTRLGNWAYTSLILLITGPILILVGIPFFKGKEKQDVGQPAYIQRHDFFWIPISIWGIILLGLGIYLKFF